jgi:hypothetical protein
VTTAPRSRAAPPHDVVRGSSAASHARSSDDARHPDCDVHSPARASASRGTLSSRSSASSAPTRRGGTRLGTPGNGGARSAWASGECPRRLPVVLDTGGVGRSPTVATIGSEALRATRSTQPHALRALTPLDGTPLAEPPVQPIGTRGSCRGGSLLESRGGSVLESVEVPACRRHSPRASTAIPGPAGRRTPGSRSARPRRRAFRATSARASTGWSPAVQRVKVSPRRAWPAIAR